MPNVPKFVADKMESFFGRAAEVVEIEELAPRLRRVRIEGDALRGLKFAPGYEIELRVSDTELRHYTPSLYNPGKGACEVIFYSHGEGSGAAWSSRLALGSKVKVLGPGKGMSLDPDATSHVFLGDESCIGLFTSLVSGLPKGARATGAVEVDAVATSWSDRPGLSLEPVDRDPSARGHALSAWVDRASIPNDAAVYVAGHTGTILSLRRTLTEGRGVRRKQVRTKPHWADGKRGL